MPTCWYKLRLWYYDKNIDFWYWYHKKMIPLRVSWDMHRTEVWKRRNTISLYLVEEERLPNESLRAFVKRNWPDEPTLYC